MRTNPKTIKLAKIRRYIRRAIRRHIGDEYHYSKKIEVTIEDISKKIYELLVENEPLLKTTNKTPTKNLIPKGIMDELRKIK